MVTASRVAPQREMGPRHNSARTESDRVATRDRPGNGSTRVIYEFGPYRLEPGLGLFRGCDFVALPPKELGVLAMLVGLEGRLAGRDDLLDAVWPDQEVSCDSITRCVYSLRRLLGDADQSYVATVPRRGYRIATPVKRLEVSVEPRMSEKAIRTAPLVHAHYRQAMCEANLPGNDHQQRAVTLLQEALRLDPGYTVATGAIAECRVFQSIFGYVVPKDGLRLGRDACERALAADPVLVSANAALGWFEAVSQRQSAAGLRRTDGALAVDDEYARGHALRAWILLTLGRMAEALDAARIAVRLDPHSALNMHTLTMALFYAGESLEALELARKVVREIPTLALAHCNVAMLASWLGFDDEGLAAAMRADELSNGHPFAQTTLAFALGRGGRAYEARAVAVEAMGKRSPYAPRSLAAVVFATLGDDGQAVGLLRLARAEHCPWFPLVRFDPRLEQSIIRRPEILSLYGDPAPAAS